MEQYSLVTQYLLKGRHRNDLMHLPTLVLVNTSTVTLMNSELELSIHRPAFIQYNLIILYLTKWV